MSDAGAPGLGSVPGETKLVIGLVSGAEFVNHTYLVLFPPILGLLAADFEVSLTLLGIAMGAQGLSNTVFQLPFGHLSDHYDRKLAYGLSLGLGSLGTLIVAAAPSYAVLLVGQLIIGIGVAGHHPTHFPLLAEATSPHVRGRAFSVRGFAGNLGFAAPPAIITAVIAVGGMTWRHAVALIGVAGGLYLVGSMYVLYRYVDPAVTRGSGPVEVPGGASPSIGGRIAAAGRSLVASPAVLSLAGLAFLSSMASWGVTTFTVILLTEGYGVGLDLANLTLTGMFLAGAAMTLVGGDLADRFRPGPLIVSSIGVVGGLLVAFGSTSIPVVAALGVVVLIGGVRSLGGPARSKLADAYSTRGNLGQSFAVVTVGMMIGSAVAPSVFGAIIETVDLQVAFFSIAGVTFLAALFAAGVVVRYGGGNHDRKADSG